MPVTSTTSCGNASLVEDATSERQYERKNSSKEISEKTRMTTAIIAGSPPISQEPVAHPSVFARRRKPKPAATDSQRVDPAQRRAKWNPDTNYGLRSWRQTS